MQPVAILASDGSEVLLESRHGEGSADWRKCAAPIEPRHEEESGDWHKCAAPLDPPTVSVG